MSMSQIMGHAVAAVNKKSPAILAGLAIAGVVATTVSAVKVTPKAMQVLEAERKTRLANGNTDPFTKSEVVKLTWKFYIPTLAIGGVTIACIAFGNTINTKRITALAGVYTITETAAREYQEKVVELLGEKKDQLVRDSLAKDHITAAPSDNAQIIITGKGETLCYDTISGRYFKSDIEELRRVENVLNQRLIHQNTISLNELYSELNLDHVKMGDDMGWVSDNLIEFRFSSQLTREGGQPCLVLDYRIDPTMEPFRTW